MLHSNQRVILTIWSMLSAVHEHLVCTENTSSFRVHFPPGRGGCLCAPQARALGHICSTRLEFSPAEQALSATGELAVGYHQCMSATYVPLGIYYHVGHCRGVTSV